MQKRVRAQGLTKPSISPASVNLYQSCLGKIEHLSIGWSQQLLVWNKYALNFNPEHPLEVEFVAYLASKLTKADFYPLSFMSEPLAGRGIAGSTNS